MSGGLEITKYPPLSDYKEFITVNEAEYLEFKDLSFYDAVNELILNGYIVIKWESKCWNNYKQQHLMKVLLGRLKDEVNRQ